MPPGAGVMGHGAAAVEPDVTVRDCEGVVQGVFQSFGTAVVLVEIFRFGMPARGAGLVPPDAKPIFHALIQLRSLPALGALPDLGELAVGHQGVALLNAVHNSGRTSYFEHAFDKGCDKRAAGPASVTDHHDRDIGIHGGDRLHELTAALADLGDTFVEGARRLAGFFRQPDVGVVIERDPPQPQARRRILPGPGKSL